MHYKSQVKRNEVGFIGAIVFSIFSISVLVMALQVPDQILGLIPGQWSTSYSIMTMAWVHGDLDHLLNNLALLVPYMFLLAVVSDRMHVIYFSIALLVGILIFFLHPRAIIIGVSGVIFGLPAYLLLRTLIDPEFWCHIISHVKARKLAIALKDFCTQVLIMFVILVMLYRDLDILMVGLERRNGVSNLSHMYGIYAGVFVFAAEFVYLFHRHFIKKIPYTRIEEDNTIKANS